MNDYDGTICRSREQFAKQRNRLARLEAFGNRILQRARRVFLRSNPGEIGVVFASNADAHGNLRTSIMRVKRRDVARNGRIDVGCRDAQELADAARLKIMEKRKRERVVDIAADIRVEDHGNRRVGGVANVKKIAV